MLNSSSFSCLSQQHLMSFMDSSAISDLVVKDDMGSPRSSTVLASTIDSRCRTELEDLDLSQPDIGSGEESSSPRSVFGVDVTSDRNGSISSTDSANTMAFSKILSTSSSSVDSMMGSPTSEIFIYQSSAMEIDMGSQQPLHHTHQPWLSLDSDFTELLHSSFDECEVRFDIPTPPSHQDMLSLSASGYHDLLSADTATESMKMAITGCETAQLFNPSAILPTPAPSTPASPLLSRSATRNSVLLYEEGIAPFKLFDLTECGTALPDMKSSHFEELGNGHGGVDLVAHGSSLFSERALEDGKPSTDFNKPATVTKRVRSNDNTPPPSGTSSPTPAKRVKTEPLSTGSLEGSCLPSCVAPTELSAPKLVRKTSKVSSAAGKSTPTTAGSAAVLPNALRTAFKGTGSTTTTSTSLTEEIGGVVVHKVRVTSTSSTGEVDISDISVPSNLNEAEAKRHVHNVLERKRREDLRQSFDTLREAVPDLVTNDKSPKVLILNGAANYIRALTARNKELCESKERLTMERQAMLTRLETLIALQSVVRYSSLPNSYIGLAHPVAQNLQHQLPI
ncbi:hypothetical protein SARC_00061 [Sphaeroforma arctica JP610]|uniref:BHLH domain-containing protein n=1 Tax=Sphaeroforma arctica JP610 TaxID=667725 RepID=A0A0L0GG15_9EUKA|nr:hypothetical protein SARC_00061 [Sphaeroforma arctica JP610]KNC87804.1 hypothetical protein SARC_00061 [Sphaeroforma arctica JP610]|eukprot:XP_014161706.1 hypothetical protein SARC_00061 [Sphaeroforma arctica JP610]